jgi:hypothetical protein
MLRHGPLLLALDERTSALDAATEHALFERYAAAAHEAGRGRGVIGGRPATGRAAVAGLGLMPDAWFGRAGYSLPAPAPEVTFDLTLLTSSSW